MAFFSLEVWFLFFVDAFRFLYYVAALYLAANTNATPTPTPTPNLNPDFNPNLNPNPNPAHAPAPALDP